MKPQRFAVRFSEDGANSISEAAFKEVKEALEKAGSKRVEYDRDIRARTITTVIDLDGTILHEVLPYDEYEKLYGSMPKLS
jgi:tRNA splicing ligase